MRWLALIALLAGCGGTSFPWDRVTCTAVECRATWLDEQGDAIKVLTCEVDGCTCHEDMDIDQCEAPDSVTQDGLHRAWKEGCCQ